MAHPFMSCHVHQITEWSDTDNDEAQSVMARQLNGDFVDLMGGPSHGAALFPLLEKLAGEEEAVVREAVPSHVTISSIVLLRCTNAVGVVNTQAVDSLSKVISKIVKTDVATKCLPMLKRMMALSFFTHFEDFIHRMNVIPQQDLPMVIGSQHVYQHVVYLQLPILK
jgi:hypothetical protein